LAYYRIRPRWRETGLRNPPATENLMWLAAGGNLAHNDVYQLDRPFVEYLRRLNTFNGNDKAWRFIAVPNAGIFNYTRTPDDAFDYEWYEKGQKPFHNPVGFDGNIVNVIEVHRGFALIETINTNKYVPLFNYFNRPDLVHQFTTVNFEGRLYKGGNSLTVYSPMFSRTQSVLPLENLEPFPRLPLKVTVEWAAGLNVRQLPELSSIKLSSLPQGMEARVIRYHPRGAEVWGRVQNGGFICLHAPGQPKPYSTTWKMETSPPPL
jgi:hypothetical protein